MNLGGKKRSQGTRHCGFVVSDLSSIGAGSAEGWIQHPSLLVAMSAKLLAFAKGAHSLIVGWEGPSQEDEGSAPAPIHLHLVISPGSKASQEEPLHAYFTSIQWLSFCDSSYLALGTSQGSVLFYSPRGSLLHKQVFQGTPVLQLRVRGSHNKSSQYSSVEELCVVYAKAIVRIDALDLQPLLHRCQQDVEARARKGRLPDDVASDRDSSMPRLAHQVWNVSRNLGAMSTCVDAVIAGVIPPPLLEHQSTQRYYCAITVGSDCALAAHRLSEDRSSSLTNIIMKRIMPATVSTVTALAKLLWRNSDNNQQASDYRPPEVKPQEFGRASLITSLKDRPRKGERIALSPSGAMAAITDSLGRILLVDTQALVVIRLWKGYRDAHCFFLEVPLEGNSASSSSMRSYQSPRKQDLVLCLAIHAPRREVVEIWKLRDGPRVSIVKCESGCRVIQAACRFRGSEHDMEEYVPAEAYILNGDSGHLTILSPQL